MSGYVKQALEEFDHNIPSRPYYGPFKYKTPTYGGSIQYANFDESQQRTK